jgi:UDP-N-acetylmuramate dehydrogenase
LLKNYPLKHLNTWQVGGSCSLFAAPSNTDETREIIIKCKDSNSSLYILGGGSNVLVIDGCVDATVIHTANQKSIKASDEGKAVRIMAECGCQTKALLAFSIGNGLSGFEFLTGIPGTIGGALWGNAGARGAEGFASIIQSIDTIEKDGTISHYQHDEMHWQYRTCPLTDNTAMVTGCEFLLPKTERKKIVDNIRKFSDLKKGQPLGKRTAGCVFKNPEGYSAGKLLDECGCSGMKIGGAVVSASHANFVENYDNASAQDIFDLSEKCRDKVFAEYGVKLEYEIHFLGSFKKN